MRGTPVQEHRLAVLEQRGEPTPGTVRTDVGILGTEHIVKHPEHGLTASGLAKVVTRRSMAHLLFSELACLYPGLEEVEPISTAGLHHLHGRKDKVAAIARVSRVERRTRQLTSSVSIQPLF